MSNTEKSNVTLELSDIIQIVSPINPDTDDKIFFVKYIDNDIIKLTNIDTLNELILNINEDGTLEEDYIAELHLLNRNDKKGYAKQNDLLMDTWIDIHFTGDLPFIVTGKITNTEEDMIEITTYPDNEIFYIDFAYQGLPPELNIEEIIIREQPKEDKSIEAPKELYEEYELDAYTLPEEAPLVEIKNVLIEADSIVFGEDIGEITQTIQLEDQFKRYSIESQTSDLLDEMLSTIPTIERTYKVLTKIHTQIERYKQLRETFSIFDENGNANKKNLNGPNHKPIVNLLDDLSQKLLWIIPVVSLKKKTYLDIAQIDDEDYLTIENISLKFDLLQQENIVENFKANVISGDKIKYKHLYKELNVHMTPYSNITDDNAVLKIVKDNILGIINNYDDFETETVSDNNIIKNKFTLQQYNIGLNNGRLTDNDSINIKGFLTLPHPAIKFSTINLPETSISDRAYFNSIFMNYWEIFNRKTIINEDNTSKDIFKNIKYFSLENNEEKEDDKEDEEILYESKFKKFIDSIIPKTKNLFDLVKSYIDKPINMMSIINYLEPFNVYRSDISFKQFQKIMFFIKEKLIEYKKTLQEKKLIFSELKRERKVDQTNIILELLEEADLEKIKGYGINKNTTSSEFIKKLINKDNAKLLYTVLSIKTLPLQSLENFNEIITDQLDKINIESDCSKYKISKKYYNEELLTKDNNKNIFYDQEFDNTDYKFIDKYRNETSTLSNEDLLPFISKKLQEEKQMSPDMSVIEAKAIIDGKKIIQENTYAILESNNTKKYYIRKNNSWVFDNQIQENITSNEKWDSLCSVQQDCLIVDKECEDGNKIIKEKLFKNILSEYETKAAVSAFEIKEKLNYELLYNYNNIQTINEINVKKTLKYNNIQLSIGEEANELDIVISPHVNIRDIILGQSDFVKKQTYIQLFVEKYTRLPFDDESENWLYCKDTSIKLLPRFISDLANSYLLNENYLNKLQELCRDIGVLSDDGEAWVDKYSGYVIRYIDFNTDEGYDESGFKTKSRSELVEDLASIKEKTSEKTILSPEALMISNVITAISTFSGVNITSQKEFIISNVMIKLEQLLSDEETYNELVEMARKKGKKTPEYMFQKHSLILCFTVCYTFIMIQTMIPMPKTKKTFPGCIKSFSGYPLETNGDFSGLTYIVCIVNNIKSTEAPWYTIKKFNQPQLMKKIQTIMESIIKDKVIQEKFSNKIAYNATDNIKIPDEINVKMWETFLPPLVKPEITSSEPISNDYINKTLDNISKLNKKQHENINVIKGKIINFSIYIQIIISNIVKEATPLLMNSSNEPFIDNVCCNSTRSVFEFFNEKNQSITKTDKIIKNLSNLLDKIDLLTKPTTLMFDLDTRKITKPDDHKFTENIIYKSFILYCQFNKNSKINEDLLSICIDNNSSFNKNNTLQEKIKILKEEGKFYSVDTLHQLHRSIHKKINLDLTYKPYDKIDILSTIITELENQENSYIPNEFIVNIKNLISQKNTIQSTESAAMRNFKNSTITYNEEAKAYIKDFISRNLSTSKKELTLINSFFDNIKLSDPNKHHDLLTVDDINMYDITDNLFTLLINITTVYPNIIINTCDHSDIVIPKHWDLSTLHQNDIRNIIKNNNKNLYKLFDDKIIINLILKIKPRFYNLLLLASNIPRNANIKQDETKYTFTFDNEICILLFEFFIVHAMKIFVDAINEDAQIIISQTAPDFSSSIETVESKSNGDISQVDILIGEKKTNSEKIASLLFTFIDNYMIDKKHSGFSYEEVMYRVSRSKDKEKDEITSYLKYLTEEERMVENVMKNNQLERWSKGLQKGLVQYIKDTYDEERENLEKIAIKEKKLAKTDIVTEMNKDIYMLEQDEYDELTDRIEKEEYDMTNMPNDDDFDDDFEE